MRVEKAIKIKKPQKNTLRLKSFASKALFLSGSGCVGLGLCCI
jgi:hypothetical protein